MSEQLALPLRPLPGVTLEDFYPGPNAQALEAAQGLPFNEHHPLLYLSGPSDTGKTHLLLGLCERAHRLGLRSAYLPLAEADSLSPEITHGLEQLDLVALDDVYLIGGQAVWERALFALFNALMAQGGRLVVAADRAAARLPVKLPDLRSRLASGLSFDLVPMHDDDKAAWLRQEAARRGIRLGTEVAHYVLAHGPRGLSELQALLAELDRASLAQRRRLTVPFVRALLARPGSA